MDGASALLQRPDRLWPLVLVSLVLHAAGVGVTLLVRPPAIVNLDQKPIVAKLVRLGEKRPEQWLPRRDAPPPEAAPAAPDAVPVQAHAPAAPAQKAVALPAPKLAPKPSPPRPASATPGGKGTDALSRAMDRVRKDDKLASRERWGDPSGVPQGEATDATEGDRYLGLVTQALQSSYRLPATLSEQERIYLHATVVLTIEPDGRVSSFRFEKRSGNAAFDQALEQAVRESRLPPPPPELRQRYRTIGLGVNFKV
jgi:colicin import membrane protein/protein TonB